MVKRERAKALRLTLHVACGYLFLGTAFGATLAQAGFGPVWALAASGLVCAGSLQFVMVPFMASGASLVTVALTALALTAILLTVMDMRKGGGGTALYMILIRI